MPWLFPAGGQLTDDLAFERIVNTPKRGLGDKAVQIHSGRGAGAGACRFWRGGLGRRRRQRWQKGRGGAATVHRGHGALACRRHRHGVNHVELAERILDNPAIPPCGRTTSRPMRRVGWTT